MYQTKKRFRNSTNNNNVWRKYVNYYSKKNSKYLNIIIRQGKIQNYIYKNILKLKLLNII